MSVTLLKLIERARLPRREIAALFLARWNKVAVGANAAAAPNDAHSKSKLPVKSGR